MEKLNSRISHKYILYIWSTKYNKYIKVREYNTLEKIKKFYEEAREWSNLPWSKRLTYKYFCKYVPRHIDFDRYFIEHMTIKVEQTLIDCKIEESKNLH